VLAADADGELDAFGEPDAVGEVDAADRTDDVGEFARATTTITATSAASPPLAMIRALRRAPGLVRWPASSCGSGLEPPGSLAASVAAGGRLARGAPHRAQT
jgi:hypothetical protein